MVSLIKGLEPCERRFDSLCPFRKPGYVIYLFIFIFIFFSEKPRKRFDAVMTIVNRVFDQAYNDLESPKTRALILELNILLRALFTRLKVRRNRYKRFFEGSLGIEYELEFDSSSNATNASIRNELIKANGTNELEFLQLGRISVVEIEPTTPPTSAATTTQAAPSGKRHFGSN